MTDKENIDFANQAFVACLAPSEIELNTTLIGDCRETLKQLPDGCINACITSPPYWGLRDYGTAEQLGLESTPDEYVENMVQVFREVRRVMRDDGTLWLNLGDSYVAGATGSLGNYTGSDYGFDATHKTTQESAKRPDKKVEGLPTKSMVGIPWRVAFALQADGWILRQDIIWHKPNPMPEPVTDRCTKAHEYIFLMSKKSKYFFDNEAIRVPYTEPINRWGGEKLKAKGHSTWDEGTGHTTYRDRNIRPNPDGKNKRSVWTVNTSPYKDAHFAVFPPHLIEPMVLAGCPEKGIILDPFMGSGTTGMVAQSLGRSWIGCELNPEYVEMQRKRTSQQSLF